MDDSLSLKCHVDQLLKKLKLNLGFFFRNRACFSFKARKRIGVATFLPLLDYGDVVYMNASAHSLQLLDAAYHGALRFITDCKPLTHHCTVYSITNWSSLSMRWTTHWYLFIYKSIIRLLTSYVSTYLTWKQSDRSLRSPDFILFAIQSVRTELGKKAYSYAAPATWSMLQQRLKLYSFIPLGDFKLLVGRLMRQSVWVCKCT